MKNVATYRLTAWVRRLLPCSMMLWLLPCGMMLWLSVSTAHAQTAPEYRLELGGGIGLATYLGDFNGNLTKGMQPMGSVVAKYKFNPRGALALNVSYGRIKGSGQDAKTYYPNGLNSYSFSHGIMDIGVRYEQNFWSYGTGMEYRGAKRITPYIYIGFGVVIAQPDKTELGLSVPLGGGVKYKLADRLNLAVEWTVHFTTNDRLDGMKDPYGIQSSGMFKNTDCFSYLRASLTYDLWAKCRTCHNDRD